MRNYTINEAAAIYGLTPRRLQQMCKTGAIIGKTEIFNPWSVI